MFARNDLIKTYSTVASIVGYNKVERAMASILVWNGKRFYFRKIGDGVCYFV